MDARHSADIFKHLEKQSEVLMESYRAMSHELHTLQVEEEMLMKKLYELMCAEGLVEKKEKGMNSHQMDVNKWKARDSGEKDSSSSEEHL